MLNEVIDKQGTIRDIDDQYNRNTFFFLNSLSVQLVFQVFLPFFHSHCTLCLA